MISENNCCPSCGSEALDEMVPGFDAVCDSCGLAMQDIHDVDVPENGIALKETLEGCQEEKTSWPEFASASNSTEEQLVSALNVLDGLTEKLDYSSCVCRRAVELYAEAVKCRITEGRSVESVILVLLFLAGRECDDIRPLAALQGYASADEAEIKRLVRKVQIELGLEHDGRFPQEYLPYLHTELDYTEEDVEAAEYLLQAASERGLTNGKQPVGFAAAALYCATPGVESQRTLADAAGVSKETVRVRVRDVRRIELDTE